MNPYESPQAHTEKSHPPLKPTLGVWTLCYLLSPALAFICLRIARAISALECALGLLVGLTVHIGLVSVLAQTHGEPLQIFIILLLGVSLYLIVLWQYLAGARNQLWSPDALKQWRTAGRFFGGLLALSLLGVVLRFHLS